MAETVLQTDGAKVPSQDLNGPAVAGPLAFMQKYSEERSKRLREDGNRQYIDPSKSDKMRHFLDDPWIENGTSVDRPVPDGGHVMVAIIGAGYGGVLFAVKLIEAGYRPEDILIVDPAGGFGGTWYWNRYPGLMCDVESYIYMPLLEEMEYMPTHKYASGEELREYLEKICRKYGLHARAMFQSAGKTISWDASRKEWTVSIVEKPKGGSESEITVHADFVIFATGLLNNAKVPDVGLDVFQGHVFHTARWDYKYTGGSQERPELTGLEGKKVAFIGTGATAVQAVPHLARYAQDLYVFQRTPSSVDSRNNSETDPGTWKKSVAAKKGWQRERNLNFNAFMNNAEPKPSVNLVDDQWTRAQAFSALIGGPKEVTMHNVANHVGEMHALDYPRAERVRKRAEEVVKDPALAKSLQAWYPAWCKRPCFHDEYLQAFNAPNVHLIDTEGKGLDRITPHGVEFDGKEHQVDVIILGTGFVAPALASVAGKANIWVTGRDGQSMEERNDRGELSTLHGIASRDFPNMFWPGPIQGGATANQMFVLDTLSTHIAHVMAEASRKVNGKPIIEPSEEAQEQWAMQILAGAASFAAMVGCTPGSLNMEGMIDKIPPEARMKAARNSIWGRGFASYLDVLEEWRTQGDMQGLEVTAA
ncbi:hypothetical protein LTR36_007243 [Oleoguttula mirabilis]|uniref:FAD/NAD(P)-binding domain-containing protein n=1 Tax=Oleoguttula mirabilis TaxID=1507867 RepID=A0AAV9J9V0_9PEZI|nr:hypothetical protein LTR36_007243 [Oleoguttula mirabilis]